MPFELLPEIAPEQESESFLSQAGRGIARTASRIGEQVVGTPGDIFSLINDYIAKPAVEFVTGEKGVPYEETHLGKVLPTTETHRKAMEKGFGKVLQPQNDIEKYIDNLTQEATSLAVPGAKAGKVLKQFGKGLAISTASNLLGDLTKDWTGDEKKGGYAKLGSMFLLSLVDKEKAAQAVASMYKPLADKVTKLKPVNATGLEMNLSNLKNRMMKGTQAPSEQFIINEVDSILPKIKNGTITPEELWASKRSLNEKLTKVLYDIPEKTTQQRARKLAKSITHDLNETMKLTAKQDPKFYKELKNVDKAFGTIAESNLLTKFVEKNLKYNPLTHGLINLIQGSVGGGAATAALPYQVGKILYRITKSPVLAKHYGKVLSAAASENAIIMNKELKKLDKGLEQEKKKDKFILID